MRYEFATVEWIWTDSAIQVNLPGGEERTSTGSYNQVVAVLSGLGEQGWDVAACASAGNWLLWTLRRML
ncbi:hypothetical protein [Marinitenerispora sediminis]|uniref:DUF4177 domain-containing protein n=1 Tax=Marinitenerispora sediminis TaxID=1931232 RepID=A0A368TD90_9ACTN|nr:hypothetical protein [Marinitenerispora sediminis]RCV52965.1 hypothetical protein DEF28_11555 [Marinitenerispora sediminis]RCV58444.1 hypothetical protein DEF23_09025 [Marinitenerispora sediminis]RCV61776.1 hypothetical protein DEF24_03340 [Marinitenerispora sediminis]